MYLLSIYICKKYQTKTLEDYWQDVKLGETEAKCRRETQNTMRGHYSVFKNISHNTK